MSVAVSEFLAGRFTCWKEAGLYILMGVGDVASVPLGAINMDSTVPSVCVDKVGYDIHFTGYDHMQTLRPEQKNFALMKYIVQRF